MNADKIFREHPLFLWAPLLYSISHSNGVPWCAMREAVYLSSTTGCSGEFYTPRDGQGPRTTDQASSMQDRGYGLPRIPLPGTRMNKGKKKGRNP